MNPPNAIDLVVRYHDGKKTAKREIFTIYRTMTFAEIKKQLRFFVDASSFAVVVFKRSLGNDLFETIILDDLKTPADYREFDGVPSLHDGGHFLVKDPVFTLSVCFPKNGLGKMFCVRTSPLLSSSKLHDEVANHFGLPNPFNNYVLWNPQTNAPLLRDQRPIGSQGILGECSLEVVPVTSLTNSMSRSTPLTCSSPTTENVSPSAPSLLEEAVPHVESSIDQSKINPLLQMRDDKLDHFIEEQQAKLRALRVIGEMLEYMRDYSRLVSSLNANIQYELSAELVESIVKCCPDAFDVALREPDTRFTKAIAGVQSSATTTQRAIDVLLDTKILKKHRQSAAELESSIIERVNTDIGDEIAKSMLMQID